MIAVGRIGRIFGNDGGVMVSLYANFPDDFQQQEPLFVVIDKLAVPLFCNSIEYRGQSGAIITFDDIDTVRRAEEFLVGREIHMGERERDDDEFYMEDLIGFTAIIDKRKGKISDFYDSPSNPLFEITLDGKENLVPAAEEFIANINFDKRTIKFVLPDGLLEL